MAPDALAKRVTDEVLAVIRADKDIQAGNTKKVLRSGGSQGPAAFRFHAHDAAGGRRALAPGDRRAAAKPDQRISRVAGAHLHQRVHPISATRSSSTSRSRWQPGDTDVVVRSLIKQKTGADPIDINYSMEKTDAGWKVYDVVDRRE